MHRAYGRMQLQIIYGRMPSGKLPTILTTPKVAVVNFRARNVHTFGCPMYVLQSAGSMTPKWDAKARLAIYLGPSLNHAWSVGLALSLHSGLVSPVFHAHYDDRFSTVVEPYGKYHNGNLNVVSRWECPQRLGLNHQFL
jgi:hypothetical protein